MAIYSPVVDWKCHNEIRNFRATSCKKRFIMRKIIIKEQYVAFKNLEDAK